MARREDMRIVSRGVVFSCLKSLLFLQKNLFLDSISRFQYHVRRFARIRIHLHLQ